MKLASVDRGRALAQRGLLMRALPQLVGSFVLGLARDLLSCHRAESAVHTRPRLRWVGALSVMIMVVAGLVVELLTAAPAGAVIVSGPACPDVMVIAARGSGEAPQANTNEDAAYGDPTTYFGAGKTNFDLYQRILNAAPHLRISLNSVKYPAVPVFPTLLPNRDIQTFKASVDAGAISIANDVAKVERSCPGVQFVLAGYSQGAWAVHEALWEWQRAGTTRILKRIAGVALFGDPLFVPLQTIVRDDNRALLLTCGAGTQRAPLLIGCTVLRDTNVPLTVRSVTASYCLLTDPVCQSNTETVPFIERCRIENPEDPSLCAHYRYVKDGRTKKAAQFIAAKLPRESLWPRLTLSTPPVGTVDQPFIWTATAAPGNPSSYTWTKIDQPPPGLDLSSSGVLSGTPTVAGDYTFRIRATRGADGRFADGSVSVTINPGTKPPPAICSARCAVSFGSNQFGQLGDGTNNSSTVSVGVNALGPVMAMAGGYRNSLALRDDGTVWSWGDNSSGQLGNGSVTNSSVPVQAMGLTEVTAIAAQDSTSLALRRDGTVWTWGADSNTVPVQIGGLTGVTEISSNPASLHSVALRNDGTVWAWGVNTCGQLGNGTTLNSSVPVQVSGLTRVTAVAGAGCHSLALRDDGTVWAWGGNFAGQLGNGTTVDSTIPVQIGGLTGVTRLSGGASFSIALRNDGTLWAWGANSRGQLGNGTTTNSSVPVQVSGLTDVRAVSGGDSHSLAMRNDGTVWTWGANSEGQLGDGTRTGRSIPIKVSGLADARAVAGGGLHSLVGSGTPST